MIAKLEEEVLHHKKWVRNEEFPDILAFAQTIPGSVAVNIATVIGHRVSGWPGAFASLAGMVFPAFLIVLSLAGVFAAVHDHPYVQGVLKGVQPAVIALIFYAAFAVGKKVLVDAVSWIFMIAAAVLLLATSWHPVVWLIGGAAAGMMIKGFWKGDRT